MLAQIPRIDVLGGWDVAEDGSWQLPIRAQLSVSETEHMPRASTWWFVLGPEQPKDGVRVFPDAEDGIRVTFRHQTLNSEPGLGVRWRPGNVCLARPLGGLARQVWTDEPADVVPRVIWNAERLLQWVDAAASDELCTPGEPNELPSYAGQQSLHTIGFAEMPGDLHWWDHQDKVWGFVALAAIPGAEGTWVVNAFLDEAGRLLRRATWTAMVPAGKRDVEGIWVRLPSIPVIPPWRIPATWDELRRTLASLGMDLEELLAAAGARSRARPQPRDPRILFLGFPFAERIGEKPERMHWLVTGPLKFARRDEGRNGFRPIERSRRVWDRQFARQRKELTWLRTANWAPDQIRRRGAAEDRVRCARVLVLGGGSLGGALAEVLVRQGVTDLAIMDPDQLEAGNLSRHVLTLRDLGRNKALALANRLNECAPDARVEALPTSFPPVPGSAADLAFREYDVIIDCTASDTVLDAMAEADWRSEKLFVSLSMTWRAEGLLAFSASEASFLAIDAKQRFASMPVPDVDTTSHHVEAIGCWSQVFPATPDDVQMWAAIGARFVRSAILSPERRVRYWRRHENGSVEVRDA
ncbi:ThiF family adenylyltransferase [Roseomonas sp. 18066]|uniref:ThiF family adenylyltransferase n=1 Tax=Roseomonas sp. 18066 TaxID=2681412 RepID=UPI00135A635D|nr:ThiF family adenylyltransferase [Roseomonas sp. 18066]